MRRIFWIALLCVVSTTAFASDITLDLSVTGNNQKFILNAKTNLPPKTMLMANVVNPMNQGGDGYVGSASGAIKANQIVQFGPFSKSGGRLSPGRYQVTVTTIMAALQPREIQSFFGAHGEGLTGRLVSFLPGTSERLVTQKFQFTINPDGSINNPAPSNPPNDAQQTIGSPDDKWQKVKGNDGREIYVMTNGRFYPTGFHTYLVANLPESDIVGAPQSVMHDVEGNCETGTYHKLGSLFFAGKNRSGVAMQSLPPEEVERKLVPNSPFEKVFGMLCKIAEVQR